MPIFKPSLFGSASVLHVQAQTWVPPKREDWNGSVTRCHTRGESEEQVTKHTSEVINLGFEIRVCCH